MMEMNTPPEAFEPDAEGGMEGMGMEMEDMDEMDDEELAEMGESDEAAAEEAAEAAAKSKGKKKMKSEMDKQMKKKMEDVKEKIKKGKLKGDNLDKALSDVGFSGTQIDKLKGIELKGKSDDNWRTGRAAGSTDSMSCARDSRKTWRRKCPTARPRNSPSRTRANSRSSARPRTR